MFKGRTKIVASLALTGLLGFAAGSIAQGRYPDVNRAEGALNNALTDLRAARDIFGGHKQNAEGYISQALGELQAGKGYAASRGF
jgi:hypothetical protein